MRKITIPAEAWVKFAAMNNCARLAEQKGTKAVSVKAFEHGGFLHMPHAAMHCTYHPDQVSTLYTYRLLPEELLEGETTVWHDRKAIESGLRNRGDSSGLIVNVRGALMVCAFPVHFLKGIPSPACRLSLADAKAYDEKCRAWGWRHHWYGQSTPAWTSFAGHPVVHYSNDADERHVLLWRYGSQIEEMAISPSVLLPDPQGCALDTQSDHEPQMALF